MTGYRINGLEMAILTLVMIALAGGFMLTMMGGVTADVAQVQVASAPSWVQGQAIIRPGLAINGHAHKHADQALDAWRIYGLLLAGNCVASTVYCGPSDIERLYLCTDPVSGLIGGLFVFGDEIMTGYGSREAYWKNKVRGSEWEVCK